MTGEKIIVLVTDRGDSRHGEISVLDEAHKAERLVETLLEAGFEEERIRVFTGRLSEFQISQRPVVALVGEGEAEEPQTAEIDSREAVVEEPAAETEASEVGMPEEPGVEENEEEEVPAAAEMAAPVRFSSLFRSA